MSNKLKIGIVIHGPGIIDSGYARKLIKMLSNYGEVKARLGGTMGRTAVIDAHLEEVIDIKNKLLPSQSIDKFTSEEVDVVFLLNYGKSRVTGHAFGYKVWSKSQKTPLIQIERPGEPDGSVVQWGTNLDSLADEIAGKLNLKLYKKTEIIKEIKNSTGTSQKVDSIYRKIAGVSPGENILVNNMVVGQANSTDVTLVVKEGFIVEIKGGELKKHGVMKLGKINVEQAIIKTGLLRKSAVPPRILKNEYKEGNKRSKVVAFLDHAAYDIYRLRNSDMVVTVGDDTTLVAADILFRFNVPIFGITDGDLDRVVEKGYKTPGSIIVELASGCDDLIGKKVYKKCFKRKETIKIDNMENFKKELLQIIRQETSVFKIIE